MQLWRVVAHAPPVTSVNAHAVVVLARAAALWVFASRNAQHLRGRNEAIVSCDGGNVLAAIERSNLIE